MRFILKCGVSLPFFLMCSITSAHVTKAECAAASDDSGKANAQKYANVSDEAQSDQKKAKQPSESAHSQ